MQEPMTGQPENTLSDILRSLSDDGDLDSCSIMANVINCYLDAIKRRGNRSELYADDIHRIINVTRVMLSAGDIETGIAKFINRRGTPLKGKPEVVS